MDLRQLNALLAVAKTGSFSAAARMLQTVQSNVSTHVARLEQELGVALIDRATGTLTEEGEIVATRARRINAELGSIVDDLASLDDVITGTARIGVIGTIARWLAPKLVVAMAQLHPGVRLIVVDATTSSLLLQLSSGALDIAVVNLPVADPDFTTTALFDEEAIIVTPRGHRFYDLEVVTVDDLHQEPLLLEPKGTTFRDRLDEQCARAGVLLTSQAEVEGMRLLATLAFEGFGAALLPASAAPHWVGGDWKAVPIQGLDRRSVGLAARQRSQLSAPGRALRAVLLDVLARDAPHQPGIHTDSSLNGLG